MRRRRRFDESKVRRDDQGQFDDKAGSPAAAAAAVDPFVQRIADSIDGPAIPAARMRGRRRRAGAKTTPVEAPRKNATVEATAVAAKVDAFVQRTSDQIGARRPALVAAAPRVASKGKTLDPDILANINDAGYRTPAALRVRYKYGQCHALAQAIHDRTGWPMFVWWMEQGGNEHAMVRMPDGRFLDVEGVHDEWDIRNSYAFTPKVEQFRDARKLPDWDPPMMDATTRAVADALVASVGA